MSRLGELVVEYRRALDRIAELVGGDPRRPDWDPLESVGLVQQRLDREHPLLEVQT